MIDADSYWARCGLFPQKKTVPPSRPKAERVSGVTVEELEGGCMLFRLPHHFRVKPRLVQKPDAVKNTLHGSILPDGTESNAAGR